MDLTSKLLDSNEDMEPPALTECEDDTFLEFEAAFAVTKKRDPPLMQNWFREKANARQATPWKVTSPSQIEKLP